MLWCDREVTAEAAADKMTLENFRNTFSSILWDSYGLNDDDDDAMSIY